MYPGRELWTNTGERAIRWLAMATMRAAVVRGNGTVSVERVPMPQQGPYDCLCRILACATCSGTDTKIIHGTFPYQRTYPGILGHESVGEVIEVGRKVRHIAVGERFLRVCAAYPGEKLGQYHSFWGGFAEYGVVADVRAMKEDDPASQVPSSTIYQQKIPADAGISPADAAMLVTLKELASFLDVIGLHSGQSLVILGAGAVAMAGAFFAKLKGASPVIVVGRRPEVEARVRRAGADVFINTAAEDLCRRVKEETGGTGADYVIDAAGDLALFSQAPALLARGGKLASYAVNESLERTVSLASGPSLWSLVRAGPVEPEAHRYLIDLSRLGVVPFHLFYSHRMPLDRIAEAFELIWRRQAFKVVIEMEGA